MAERITENLIMPRHGSATIFKELRPVRSDILARQVHTGLFTGSYRFRRSLLAMLALKYAANLENYREEEDEDSLLVGQVECEKALSQPTGIGMEKVTVFLASLENRPVSIQAILLLEADFSDENRQKFLIRTKKRLYLRDASLGLQSYRARSAFFGAAGVQVSSKTWLEAFPIDSQFQEWHKELLLLEAPLIKNSLGWHPLAGLLATLGTDNANDAAMPYMQFLCAVASCGNALTAAKVLRLEAMSSDFGLREDVFYGLFDKLKPGKLSSGHLQKLLYKARECVPRLAPHVLYLDALEAAHDEQGECSCPAIVELLRADSYAGAEFTGRICESIKYERKAQRTRVAALGKSPDSACLNGQQFYLDSLNMNILNYGGKLNEWHK